MCAGGVSGEERENDILWVLQLEVHKCPTAGPNFAKLAPVTWLHLSTTFYSKH